MTAIDVWIADIAGNRRSAAAQPIVGPVNDCVAAWQQVLSGLTGGTVTSVGLSMPTNEFNVTGSPVTTIGTLAAAWKAQGANSFLAGPTPSFRAIAAGDIPDLSGTYLALAGGTMAGAINLPNGSAVAPSLAFNTNSGFYWDTTNTGLGITTGGLETGIFTASQVTLQHVGGNMVSQVQSEGNCNFLTTRYSTDGSASQQSMRKARGTIAAPTVIATNDFIGQNIASGWDGVSAFQTSASIQWRCIDTTPGPTAMGGRIIFNTAPIGSATLANVAQLDSAGGLQMFGANSVIDANRLLRGRIFTVATLPTAVEGALASISDATLTMITGLGLAPVGAGANHVPVFADNVGWKII